MLQSLLLLALRDPRVETECPCGWVGTQAVRPVLQLLAAVGPAPTLGAADAVTVVAVATGRPQPLGAAATPVPQAVLAHWTPGARLLRGCHMHLLYVVVLHHCSAGPGSYDVCEGLAQREHETYYDLAACFY